MATRATDAELVRRYLAGDQVALGDIYSRYGDRVYDLCFAMLSSADDAADAYQDTFLTAARKLGDLRDPERLRSWLYSIARNQCRARLRARKRTTPDEDAGLEVGVDVDMTAEVHRAELRELMAEASAGLNDRDREVLELHMRHELEGEDLADALGVSVQNAYKLVQRVRDRVERSLGSLLVARHARRECDELDELLAEWDGTFSPLWRKRIGRHVDECEICSRRRRGLMDPGGLAGAYPLQPTPADLKSRVLESLMAGEAPSREIPRWDRDGWPSEGRRVPKLLTGAVAAGVLLLAMVGGLLLLDPFGGTDSSLETVAPVVTEAPSTTEAPAPETTTVVPDETTTTTEPPPDSTTTEPDATTTTAAPGPVSTRAPITTDAPATTASTTTAAPTTTPPTTSSTTIPSTTTSTTTSSTTTSSTTTSSTTTAPPDTEAPVILRATASPTSANEPGPGTCTGTVVTVTVQVTDNVGVSAVAGEWIDSVGGNSGTFSLADIGADTWRGTFSFPIGTALTFGVPIELRVNAADAAGNNSGRVNTNAISLSPCP
ncbi:MAG: sigma-70 family RNA polymerase sigma factor [Actinomycetota bacterium]